MTIKCSVYIATSVDGYIARPDGDIDWLHKPEYADVKFNGLEYDDFMSSVDVLVMGRNSFEKVRSFGFWPYEKIPVVVLTSRSFDIPCELEGKITVANNAPKQLLSTLESQGKTHAYIDGGITIQRFLADGLIDEMTITRIPVLLGSGIPLFGESGPELPLRLISSASSDNGFVQVRYALDSLLDA